MTHAWLSTGAGAGAAVVSVCVLLAVLVVDSRSGRRLRAAQAPAGPRRRSPRPGRAARRQTWRARRSQREAVTDVATAAGELSVLLRSGLPAPAAWLALPRHHGSGLLDTAVTDAAEAAARGGDVVAALVAAASARPASPVAPAVRGLAATWSVAQRAGAPTAELLDRYASFLSSEADADDAREAALAAPRATARLLVALPAAGLLLGIGVGADPWAVLTGTAAGRICALVGGVCALAGWWWTRRLLTAAQRAGA